MGIELSEKAGVKQVTIMDYPEVAEKVAKTGRSKLKHMAKLSALSHYDKSNGKHNVQMFLEKRIVDGEQKIFFCLEPSSYDGPMAIGVDGGEQIEVPLKFTSMPDFIAALSERMNKAQMELAEA